MEKKQNRRRVIQAVQRGEISAEEGGKLLNSLEEPVEISRSTGEEDREIVSSKESRWLRVLVVDASSGKQIVNIRMPVGVIDAGVRMGAQFTPHFSGMNREKIIQRIQSGEPGPVLDILDDKRGERIQISID